MFHKARASGIRLEEAKVVTHPVMKKTNILKKDSKARTLVSELLAT